MRGCVSKIYPGSEKDRNPGGEDVGRHSRVLVVGAIIPWRLSNLDPGLFRVIGERSSMRDLGREKTGMTFSEGYLKPEDRFFETGQS